MEIVFKSHALERDCSQGSRMVRRWGSELAQKLQQRLLELMAASDLTEIGRFPPARCHELSGTRRGQLSVDLGKRMRLVFEPAHDPVPRKPDGGLDWARVQRIRVLEVVDTHE